MIIISFQFLFFIFIPSEVAANDSYMDQMLKALGSGGTQMPQDPVADQQKEIAPSEGIQENDLSPQSGTIDADLTPEPQINANEEETYKLKVGDKVQVSVLDLDIDNISSTYSIQTDGHLVLPIAGKIMAVDLTKNELSNEIAKRLSQNTYTQSPHVIVNLSLDELP